MKRLIRRFLVFFILVNFSTYANAQEKFNLHKKLLNKEVWTQVSTFRFEDNYNYLAVEWQDREYVLIDMANQNKELIRSNNFNLITKKIKTEIKKRFKPNRKLINKDIWYRISLYRFECRFLRLAVEWEDKEYVLYEMDGAKRELARSKDYSDIEKVIAKLTLK